MFIESDMNVVHVNTQQQVLSQYLAGFHWQCEHTEPRVSGRRLV